MRAGWGHRDYLTALIFASSFFLPTQGQPKRITFIKLCKEGWCSQTKSRRPEAPLYENSIYRNSAKLKYNRSRRAAARVQPASRKAHLSRIKRNSPTSMGALKLYVSASPGLLRWLRVIRALVMVGPGRAPLLGICQRLSKSLPQRLETYPTFAHVDVDQVFKCLEEVGSARIGQLPAEYVNEILAYCGQNNQTSYWNPHQTCDVIDQVARNTKILEIVRKYLGVEPRLWLSRLTWTFSRAGGQSDSDGVPPRSDSNYNIHDFHYDTHDFKSLTIFIYLTDVTMDSGPTCLFAELIKTRL